MEPGTGATRVGLKTNKKPGAKVDDDEMVIWHPGTKEEERKKRSQRPKEDRMEYVTRGTSNRGGNREGQTNRGGMIGGGTRSSAHNATHGPMICGAGAACWPTTSAVI